MSDDNNWDWTEGYEHGRLSAFDDIKPLIEAVLDTSIMFANIEKARQLPSDPCVYQQYVAMGKQLERLLVALGLKEKP